MISVMFSILYELCKHHSQDDVPSSSNENSCEKNTPSNLLRRALERTNKTNASKYRKLGSPDCTKVALLSSLYQTALGTLTQLRLDILTGRFFCLV